MLAHLKRLTEGEEDEQRGCLCEPAALDSEPNCQVRNATDMLRIWIQIVFAETTSFLWNSFYLLDGCWSKLQDFIACKINVCRAAPTMFANMFPFLSARFHSSNTYRLEKQSPIRARNVCFWVLNSDIYELLPRLLSFFCYIRLLWRIIQGVINKRFKLFWIIPISIHLSNEQVIALRCIQSGPIPIQYCDLIMDTNAFVC